LRTREWLVRGDRLATVGQLAAGVAHEVGNPVAAILGYAEATLREAELAPRGRECAEHIRDEALRVRKLVRELLDFARSRELATTEVDADDVLARVVVRLAPQPLLERVELEHCRAETPLSLTADAERVEQVLVNLIENAAHAMAGQSDARIELTAQAESLRVRGRRHSDRAAGARPADGVALSVTDNGPGIDEELLAQVFDPFFTTKGPGEGTGLGLWNGHRLAELMGGRLEVESRPGRTRFSLILPRADTRADECSPCPDHR
jgi:signal transduction histidine kinase